MKVDVITADSGPLILLAAVGRLDLLRRVGNVQIPDLVVMEATFPGAPGAETIRKWIRQGIADGLVSVPQTSTGELLRLARITKPDHQIKGAGERAIIDWLIDNIEQTNQAVMVVYENAKVRKAFRNYDSELHSAVFTTRAFLTFCEQKHYISCAASTWNELEQKFPSVYQRKDVFFSD